MRDEPALVGGQRREDTRLVAEELPLPPLHLRLERRERGVEPLKELPACQLRGAPPALQQKRDEVLAQRRLECVNLVVAQQLAILHGEERQVHVEMALYRARRVLGGVLLHPPQHAPVEHHVRVLPLRHPALTAVKVLHGPHGVNLRTPAVRERLGRQHLW